MKLRAGLIVLLGILFFLPGNARAVTMRYALVIGNNTGVDADGTSPFEPLQHAEREARVLKDKLVGLSNFDAGSGRTVLLTGATKNDVRRAVDGIARQKAADEKLLGKLDAVFLFYFTGHGLDGRLLMEDGPILTQEIAALFKKVNADFAVGVFDACHSGSLSPKGVRPTPGLNLLRELPQEVLNTRGSVWYVSSGADQASYEDEKLGGVFTHFFIEALGSAQKDGPGITLDSIWAYARSRTVAYTSTRNRPQKPQQFISNLKSSAPVYFSFPVKRSATLEMSASMSGRFALSYAEGVLTEIIDKPAGTIRRISVYPGQSTLSELKDGKSRRVAQFDIAAGQTLVLKKSADPTPAVRLGESSSSLWAKGVSDGADVQAARVGPGTSVSLKAGYGLRGASSAVLLPLHSAGLGVQIDTRSISVSVEAGYGFEEISYPAWGYETDSVNATAAFGGALNMGSLRLLSGLMFQYEYVFQKFDDGTEREGGSYLPALWIGVLAPQDQPVFFGVRAFAGALNARAESQSDDRGWAFAGGLSASVYFRLN